MENKNKITMLYLIYPYIILKNKLHNNTSETSRYDNYTSIKPYVKPSNNLHKAPNLHRMYYWDKKNRDSIQFAYFYGLIIDIP